MLFIFCLFKQVLNAFVLFETFLFILLPHLLLSNGVLLLHHFDLSSKLDLYLVNSLLMFAVAVLNVFLILQLDVLYLLDELGHHLIHEFLANLVFTPVALCLLAENLDLLVVAD